MRKNYNWHGLIKIQEIGHLSKTGDLLWKQNNLYNTLHLEGEEYILKVLFGGESLPSFYLFGLDNRDSLSLADTMNQVQNSGEPNSNGYERQSVESTQQFEFAALESGVYTAKTPTIFFTATNASWSPVKNLFMTTEEGYDGYLIASVPLSQQVTVLAGETIYMKMGLQLRDDATEE